MKRFTQTTRVLWSQNRLSLSPSLCKPSLTQVNVISTPAADTSALSGHRDLAFFAPLPTTPTQPHLAIPLTTPRTQAIARAPIDGIRDLGGGGGGARALEEKGGDHGVGCWGEGNQAAPSLSRAKAWWNVGGAAGEDSRCPAPEAEDGDAAVAYMSEARRRSGGSGGGD
jgi:hypothetical protein